MRYDVQNISVALIDPPADAHRLALDEQRLGDLADSMAAEGLHQPIGLRGPDGASRYEVVFGHRRYRAAAMLGWASIAAKIYPAAADILLIRSSENNNREQLSPAEEAEQIRRFQEAGYSKAGTARALRRSVSWVEARLAILACPEDVRLAVHRGELSLGVAVQFATVDHAPYRRELIAEAGRAGCSTTQATAWVAAYGADRERIVRNLATVEEIAASREQWVLKIACEGCGLEHTYERTRAMRFCLSCANDLLAAMRGEPASKPA
jgi:ParB family chromosome partitioning protein